MKTLDQHEVEFKEIRTEKTFEQKKKSRTWLSLGGLFSGLFILAGKITSSCHICDSSNNRFSHCMYYLDFD